MNLIKFLLMAAVMWYLLLTKGIPAILGLQLVGAQFGLVFSIIAAFLAISIVAVYWFFDSRKSC